MGTDFQHLLNSHTYQAALTDIEVAQEREPDETTVTDFSCPAVLWQGLFERIARTLNKYTWEVWLGILCALGAIAHKNLHWHYYRNLYGMVYGLLIAPTGIGKGTCTDVCWALLPEGYTVRDAPSSGPGLFPILANIQRNEKDKILSLTSRPAILIIEEWSTLLKFSKIEFSNLQETLNTLFHREKPWSISRSDTDKSGGDRSIPNPTLSICATTTESLLREHVTSKMIRSGFLNRYFVVPGSPSDWEFYNREKAGVSANRIKGYADHLIAAAWGAGRTVWDAYSAEAETRLASWGNAFFNPLMRTASLEAESLKRLHTYAHIISLLYAWSEECSAVLPRHVEAAVAVTTISRAFMEQMISKQEVEIPKYKQYQMSLETKILTKVGREPGIGVKKIGNDLRGSGTYQDITETARRLSREGQLRLVKQGRAESFYPSEGACEGVSEGAFLRKGVRA